MKIFKQVKEVPALNEGPLLTPVVISVVEWRCGGYS